MNKITSLLLIIWCWLVLSQHARADQFVAATKTVARFDYLEITLTLDAPVQGNPFIDASLRGEFSATNGAAMNVDGFCDSADGRVFRIRFMPVVTGRHRYSLVFQNGDKQLKHSSEFTALAARHKGRVQLDKDHPTHFIWEDSAERFFYNSTTAYWLLGFKDDAVIRESLDRLTRLRINRIRVALSGRTTSGMRWKEPMIVSNEAFQYRLEPWPAARPMDIENPGYDVTRFNVEFFRKAERMLAHARASNLQVSLIFALDVRDKGVDPFGNENMGNADEQRYYRYCVARFGAFANVWWDVINEWHLCRDEAWVAKMGALVKEWDPYDHLTSVHGKERFPFAAQKWVDYVMFQSWDEAGAYDFMLKARDAQRATGRPLPIINEEYGYEDHYPYPWGGKRVWPARIGENRARLAWEMTMAGGYQTTGERANVAGMGGWITGRGNDEMTMLAAYARMRSFFESFAWWKLEPHPELVAGESKALPVIESGAPIAPALCLAQPGERYVIYLRQGGTATLQLAAGRYAVKRYNPRTGLSVSAGEAEGSRTWTSPAVADTEPWVFLLEKKP
jgi:hypothetical protein